MSDPALKFPFKFEPLTPEENAAIKENFDLPYEFVRVVPKNYVVSSDYEADAEYIYNFELRADDVIVDTFPRSGTTWTQELVWLIVNDLDYEAASLTPLTQRYFFLEFPSFFTFKTVDKIVAVNKAKGVQVDEELLRSFTVPAAKVLPSCPSPRFIKTHMPLSLLPPNMLDTTKVVYVARDPRDAAVSFYHHNRLFTYLNYKGDFKTYWGLFKNNLIFWTPYFSHVKEAWDLRHHPNMLFLFYEELSKDLPATVRRVADFYGKKYSDEQFAGLCDHLDIKNFKNNKSVNASEFEGMSILKSDESFIRKGKVGGWRDYFDDEMVQEAESWIEENLWDTDLRFPHLDRKD